MFLKLPNVIMLIKQETQSLSRYLANMAFGQLLVVLPTKPNLLYLFYLMALRFFLLCLIKQKCLLKTFLKTLILMAQISLFLLSLLDLILNFVELLQLPSWWKGHNQRWCIEGICSWLYSRDSSEELQSELSYILAQLFKYVPEGVLFPSLLEGLIWSSCI